MTEQPTNGKKKQCKPAQEMVQNLKGSPEEVQAFNLAVLEDEFIFASTFIQQIGFLCEKLRTNVLRVKYRQIGEIFGVSRQKVQKCHMKYLRGEGIDGRPPILSPRELQMVEDEIHRLHRVSYYPTAYRISEFIYNNFHKNFYLDTIRHIIRLKFQKIFKTVTGVPLEDKRFESSITDIENNLNLLSRSINGIPIEFIFNLDEMGVSEFEDGREKVVIVPIDYRFTTAPYPVCRVEKHSTCLACINCNGLFCPPQYILQRSTIDSEIYQYLDPNSIQCVHTETGYINTKSFIHWIYSQFLPALNDLRQKHSYYGPAVLILDGLSAHFIGIKNINLMKENLIVHFLVSHSSDQTQPLDLCIFGNSKQFMSNYRYNHSISRQSNQIIKIHTALCQATTQLHCRAAFRSIGIDSQIQNINGFVKILARFNLCLINKVRDYQISHIQQLVNMNLPLTPNQNYIYQILKQNQQNQQNTNSNTNYRISVLNFSKPLNKNNLVMPIINIPKSNP